MKSKRINCLGFILFLCTFCAIGQDFQRKVLYETTTCKTFSVPCDVVLQELSELDLVYLQAKLAKIKRVEFVISQNWLSVINIYPQQPRYERDYEYETGKSVTDKWGTTLYTHQGEAY